MIERDWTPSDAANAADAEDSRNWWRKVRSDPDGSPDDGWPDSPSQISDTEG